MTVPSGTQIEMKYAWENIPGVWARSRSVSARYDFEVDVDTGDHLRFLDPDGREFAVAKVKQAVHMSARTVYQSFVNDHRGYPYRPSLTFYLDELNGYYDDEIKPETPLLVVEYEVLHTVQGYPINDVTARLKHDGKGEYVDLDNDGPPKSFEEAEHRGMYQGGPDPTEGDDGQ